MHAHGITLEAIAVAGARLLADPPNDWVMIGRPTVARHVRAVHGGGMLRFLAPLFAVAAVAVPSPSLRIGRWDVTSTVVEFAVPGVPSFIARMIGGKSRAERKRLRAGDGVEALLAPDPKAHCRIGSQRVADGRYAQALLCFQKNGTSLRIARSGTYDTAGFAGQAIVSGATPKGALRIVLDQRAARVGG